MRISFIADVHAGSPRRLGGQVESGINWRGRLILHSLKLAVEKAKEESDVLVVCGDLFDSARPEPQLVAAVQKILEGMQTILLVGNHDRVSAAPGDHALGPLEPVATVVEQPEVYDLDGTRLLCLPFRKEPAEEWFPVEMAKHFDVDVVAAHFGIVDLHTALWLKDSPDALRVTTAFAALGQMPFQKDRVCLFVGNWHEASSWDGPRVSVCQVGALVPTGWDNPSSLGSSGPGDYTYGGFAVYDSGTRIFQRWTIPGPRFRTASDVTGLRRLISGQMGLKDEPTFVRATVPPEQLSEAVGVVKEFDAADRVEVLADDTLSEVAARAAAYAATSAETLDQALEGYVSAMELPAGVLSSDVLQRAKDFLRENRE